MTKQQFNKIHGEFIRLSRMENGITVKELADAVGMCASHLYSFECGNSSISVYLYYRLCEKLQIPFEL